MQLDKKEIELLQKANKIISERWFCIFEINNFRVAEFILDFKTAKNKILTYLEKRIIIFIIIIFIIIVFTIISITIRETNNEIISIIFLSTPIIIIAIIQILVIYINVFKKIKRLTPWSLISNIILKSKIVSKSKWLKNNFIVAFENNIIIDNKIFPIKNWDLTTNEDFLKFMFEKWEDYIEVIKNIQKEEIRYKDLLENDKIISVYITHNRDLLESFKKINKKENFFENILLLDKAVEELILIKNDLEWNISQNEEYFYQIWEITKLFWKMTKKVEEILKIKEKANTFLKNNFPKEIFFEKFTNYLKNQLTSPLIDIRNILERNAYYIDYLMSQNNFSDDENIILLNKRLELQKNDIKNNILIIENKIKSLN